MTLVIGVDVAKDFSTYSFFFTNGSIIKKPFNVSNDSIGFNYILSEIEKVTNDDHSDTPVIIMESTGYFSNRLRDFYLSQDLKVLEINPLVSHSIKNVSIRKVKTDKADSIDLANIYISSLRNNHLASKLHFCVKLDEDILALRTLTRSGDKLTKARSSLKLNLIATLEQVLPSYNNVFKNVTCKSSLAVLIAINQDFIIDKKRVLKMLKKITPNRSAKYFNDLYCRLVNCLHEAKSTGRYIPACFKTIKSFIALIESFDEQLESIDKDIISISNSVNEVSLLKTIPGISDISAATIASEIGDIQRFENQGALVAFCGIDPAVKQSGGYSKEHNRISKRGAPRLRGTLYVAAMVSIIKSTKGNLVNYDLYNLYQKKKTSKPSKVALCIVMHKLVRIIYSLLKNNKEYTIITPDEQVEIHKSKLKVIA